MKSINIKNLKLVTLYFLLAFLCFSVAYQANITPSVQRPITLQSNSTHYPLHRPIYQALEQAKHSITIYSYSISDQKIIRLLNKKFKEGLNIKIFYDLNAAKTFSKKVLGLKLFPRKISKGIMHKKICIIDTQYVWIGSANLTTHSLYLHDNLIIGLYSPSIALDLERNILKETYIINNQTINFYLIPKHNNAIDKILKLINSAKKTIKIAMFTWTHPQLADALIQAHKRKVKVEVILDAIQVHSTSKAIFKKLLSNNIRVGTKKGLGLMHHKLALIDDKILVTGSANWSRSGFGRNEEILMLLYPLKNNQQQILQKIWKTLKHQSIFIRNK